MKLQIWQYVFSRQQLSIFKKWYIQKFFFFFFFFFFFASHVGTLVIPSLTISFEWLFNFMMVPKS